VTSPWDGERIIKAVATVTLVVGIVWWWMAQGRTWVRGRWQWGGARRGDPVRATAGRWLGEIAETGFRIPDGGRRADAGANGSGADEEVHAVVAELQRVRFGARETWVEPEGVFRRARRVVRAARSMKRQG
jgi:hypothetical protein